MPRNSSNSHLFQQIVRLQRNIKFMRSAQLLFDFVQRASVTDQVRASLSHVTNMVIYVAHMYIHILVCNMAAPNTLYVQVCNNHKYTHQLPALECRVQTRGSALEWLTYWPSDTSPNQLPVYAQTEQQHSFIKTKYKEHCDIAVRCCALLLPLLIFKVSTSLKSKIILPLSDAL